MSIKQLIKRYTVLCSFLLLVVVLIQVYAFRIQIQQSQNERAVEEIVLLITSFLIDQSEYQITRNERVFDDWKYNYTKVTSAIQEYPDLMLRLEDELNLIEKSMYELAAMEETFEDELLSAKAKSIINRNNVASRIILSRATSFYRATAADHQKKLSIARIMEISIVSLFLAFFLILLNRFFNSLDLSFDVLLKSIKRSINRDIPRKRLLSEQELNVIKLEELHTIAAKFNNLHANNITYQQQLRQFGYIASHNIRGPVASMSGLVNMLKEQIPQGDTSTQIISYLDKSVSKLDQVIMDMHTILEYKEPASDRHEEVILSKVVANIRTQLLPAIDTADARIKTNFAEVDRIESSKAYIQSIFYNLISNAIKYRNPCRPLELEICSGREGKKSSSRLKLSFKDNGLGIDLNLYGDQIFGMYKQFHEHKEGKGIGLYMVKTQIEALGGEIEVESELGKGSTFYVYLYL